MNTKQKHIAVAILVSIGFLGLALGGWNPYTGFLFALTMFLAGTSLPEGGKKSKAGFENAVTALQGIAILGAMCTAALISGEEAFHRIIRNPLFLFLCWSWVQLVVLERFHRHKKSKQGEKTP